MVKLLTLTTKPPPSSLEFKRLRAIAYQPADFIELSELCRKQAGYYRVLYLECDAPDTRKIYRQMDRQWMEPARECKERIAPSS